MIPISGTRYRSLRHIDVEYIGTRAASDNEGVMGEVFIYSIDD